MGRRVPGGGFTSTVRQVRLTIGLSQQGLADRAGLTRQAIGAIEAGQYIPNTAVALRLARILGRPVESLFQLVDETTTVAVDIVGRSPELRRLVVAQVRDRWVGHALTDGRDVQQGFVGADGIAEGEGPTRNRACLLVAPERLERTALLLGCDPSLGVLATHVGRQYADARVVWLPATSADALGAIVAGHAHVAGSHLRDPQSDVYNLPQARRALAGYGGVVVAYARWEQGLVVAPGNAKGIRAIADLARPDVRIVNREAGAGCRALLDELLGRAGILPTNVAGYGRIAAGHVAVATTVASGGADAGIALRATARALGLDFVPLAEARFDLIIPRDHLTHPAIVVMLDVLQGRALRADVRALAGYDVEGMGTIIETVSGAA